MRPCLVVLLLAYSISGAASPLLVEPRTIVEDPAEIQVLSAVANDPSASQDQRAQAIFTLFSRYVPAGAPAAEIHRLIPNSHWLDDSQLEAMWILGGWIPVEWSMEDTVAHINLFPGPVVSAGRRWVIYLHLKGNVSEDDFSRLLREDPTSVSSTLVEFALCFPPTSDRKMRIENYTPQGRRVMGM